ncbi:peptidoglycan-binding domain-containing protein [Ruegeria pomeroyi]|nr:peptidoglycan-binding domain-containing protein [Ruegeria pomeroyi]
MFFKLTRIMALTIACFLASEATVAGPEEPFLKTAEIVYAQANASEGDLRLRSLRKVREILDGIVADYPASDLAVKILLKETVNGIEVAALDAELAAAATTVPEPEPVPETSPAAAPPVPDAAAVDPFAVEEPEPAATEPHAPEIARVLSLTTEETEKALQLDRQAVRDIQARLLVLGHDPNGIDGRIGNGTRGAIRSWQSSVAAPPTGYLDAGQLASLKTASESILALWLQNEKNARMYEPPPPIALTPSRVSGRWTYVTNCGPRSKVGRAKINGVMAVRHAGGNRYTGNLSNSQGLRARFDARLSGRTVSSVANFGLLIGKVRLTAQVDDHQLVMRGRDSNGCSFYASK